MIRVTELKGFGGDKSYLMRDDKLNFFIGNEVSFQRVNDAKAERLAFRATGIKSTVKLRTFMTQNNMEGGKYE